MEPGEQARAFDALRAFGEARLAAERYPDCHHRFRAWRCGGCGGAALTLTVERHPGDRPGDFQGIVWVTCAACRVQERGLSIIALQEAPIEPLSTVEVACACGRRALLVGACERWEDWGFFDEGCVVAGCLACGAQQVVVDTD